MRTFISRIAAVALIMFATQSIRASVGSTVVTSSFGGNTYDQISNAVTSSESLTGVTMSDSQIGFEEQEGNFFTGYYYVYGTTSASSNYSGTVNAVGRPVVGIATTSNLAEGSNAGGNVTGPGESYLGTNAGVALYTAAGGATVSLSETAVGYGSYVQGTAQGQMQIVDAPKPVVSNISAYLQSLNGPVNTIVPVQIGMNSFSASRGPVTVLSTAIPSPYKDQIDAVGTLYLNGNPVGGFDEPIVYAAGDGTGQYNVVNNFTTANVDFSNLAGPTANLTLNYSILDTSYDALGNTTQNMVNAGSFTETVAVPEPASLSFLGVTVASLMLRRRSRVIPSAI